MAQTDTARWKGLLIESSDVWLPEGEGESLRGRMTDLNWWYSWYEASVSACNREGDR